MVKDRVFTGLRIRKGLELGRQWVRGVSIWVMTTVRDSTRVRVNIRARIQVRMQIYKRLVNPLNLALSLTRRFALSLRISIRTPTPLAKLTS